MILSRVLLPAAAFALAALAWAAPASASPLGRAVRPVKHAAHQGVSVHAGVVVPVRPAPRRVVVPPRRRGHYEIRIERIWVPDEIVGQDCCGHPIVRPGYWTEQEVRVWVPHRRRGHIHRHPRRGPPRRGHVAVGVNIY